MVIHRGSREDPLAKAASNAMVLDHSHGRPAALRDLSQRIQQLGKELVPGPSLCLDEMDGMPAMAALRSADGAACSWFGFSMLRGIIAVVRVGHQ